MNHFNYLVNGVVLRVNRPIQDLTPIDPVSISDLSVWLGTLDTFRERHPDLNWAELLDEPFANDVYNWWHRSTHQGDQMVFQSSDQNHLMVAILSSQGDWIEIGWCGPENIPYSALERVATTVFLPRLLGFALRLSGRIVLHGNAVSFGNQAIAWVGTAGAGKSTLTAAFLDAGFRMLCDDQIAIHDQKDVPVITTGFLRLRLWPESLSAITQTSRNHHLQQPFGSHIKGYLDLQQYYGELDTPTWYPLSAIYVLKPRQGNLAAPQCETIPASKGLYLLFQHCMGRNSLPFSESQKRREFNNMGNLVQRVPVCSLQLPDNLALLPNVVQTLVGRSNDA
jgi:hypothetical protein